ncbi:caspase domain-containing protein [Streptomyces sp. NPDC086082]|uniref:caspase family protein n=1 Tax=Streptomyces sp. NPDC086082 TaxID=3365750 RepID=UPI00382FD321
MYDSPELEDVPAVERNLTALQQALALESGGIVPLAHCTVIQNPMNQATVGEAIARAADSAEDLLLIYYSGHGLLSSARHELFLATQGTVAGSYLPFTAVDFSHVRDACLQSSAKNRVLILDCCYSGRAIPGTLSTKSSGSLFLDQVQISGTYTLTASPANSVAKVHPGSDHTAFTGELVRILRDGVPDGGELLSLSAIYRALHCALRANGNPTPQQCNTALAGALAVGRNRAYKAELNRAGKQVGNDVASVDSFPLSFPTFRPGRTVEVPVVPRTANDRARLLVDRPHSWDYLLYASSLFLGLRSIDDKWKAYEEGCGENQRRMSVAQLCRYLDDSIDGLKEIISGIDECLSRELQDRAFEARSGEEDPELIMRMASRLIGIQEDFIGWAMNIRGIAAPPKAARLIESAASLADRPARQVRTFIEEYIKEVDGLSRHYAEGETASISVNLTLELELDKGVIEDFLRERTKLN